MSNTIRGDNSAQAGDATNAASVIAGGGGATISGTVHPQAGQSATALDAVMRAQSFSTRGALAWTPPAASASVHVAPTTNNGITTEQALAFFWVTAM